MSATGIGAAVRRKEDFRFITGKGQYTDDVSRPGRRMYTGYSEVPWVRSGLGISILSTPKGLMTGRQAKRQKVGGELICNVW